MADSDVHVSESQQSLCSTGPEIHLTLSGYGGCQGPDTLPALCKPYAYWVGFIHLAPQGGGFGTLFSAIYERLALNC